MDEFLTASVIQWYEAVEERLLEFLRFFPLIEPNLNVSSPRLASVITEACDILDSLFREVAPATVTTPRGPVPRSDLNIVNFAQLYAAKLDLPATKSVVLVSPPRYVIPFSAWGPLASGGTYSSAPWWSAYTKMKHSGIAEIGRATLNSAVESVCALHQVIGRLPDLARATLRHGWLQTGGWSPEYVVEALASGANTRETHLVETQLFATPVGTPNQFPDDIAQFHPISYQCSTRIVRFFGRH